MYTCCWCYMLFPLCWYFDLHFIQIWWYWTNWTWLKQIWPFFRYNFLYLTGFDSTIFSVSSSLDYTVFNFTCLSDLTGFDSTSFSDSNFSDFIGFNFTGFQLYLFWLDQSVVIYVGDAMSIFPLRVCHLFKSYSWDVVPWCFKQAFLFGWRCGFICPASVLICVVSIFIIIVRHHFSLCVISGLLAIVVYSLIFVVSFPCIIFVCVVRLVFGIIDSYFSWQVAHVVIFRGIDNTVGGFLNGVVVAVT